MHLQIFYGSSNPQIIVCIITQGYRKNKAFRQAMLALLIYNNNVTNGCSISCSGRQGSASLVIDAEGVNALILSAVTKC